MALAASVAQGCDALDESGEVGRVSLEQGVGAELLVGMRDGQGESLYAIAHEGDGGGLRQACNATAPLGGGYRLE